MPKVSIIVPVYNIEAYLPRCVDSLLSQTLKDIEILLIDDGSTDSSGAVCDEYAKTDRRIRVFHKANGGLSDARNAGLNLAGGDFIGFADGDDAVMPEMFEALYLACTENKTLISACDRAYRTWEEVPELSLCLRQCRVMTSEEFFGEVLERGDTVSMGVWNKLYAKPLFDGVRFPVGKLHEDNATLYRLVFKTDRVAYIPVQYYLYQKRPGSLTLTAYGQREHDRYEADHGLFRYLASCHPDMVPSAAKYLCISNLYIARNMVLSGAHDSGLYRKTQEENRRLLEFLLGEDSLSPREKAELRIMCAGYFPYRVFLRLRGLWRKLHVRDSAS